ncbi:hypothetical protein [Jidongwangia harbinensis]|uniref:hypothetical protein n=1 Tax=Jidongwangia harbinensis TaxID=2878561 RepID=UPI001CD9C766|nr:hypothetical protein [Jidongwangia harbinensis]MCA2218849.1 hypothetical protein [Jidongwangia harbinensis]
MRYPVPPIYEIYVPEPAAQLIAQAENQLVGQCMTRQGFRFEADPPNAESERPTPFGYEELPPSTPLETVSSETAPTTDSSAGPAGYERALQGDHERRLTIEVEGMKVSAPADGCRAEAQRRLRGNSRVEWMRLRIELFRIENRALQSLEHDTRVRAATERWRACVNELGFTWSKPTEVQDSLPIGADPRSHPSTLADLKCKYRTNYLPDAYASLGEAQRRELGPEPTALSRWRELFGAQEAAARQVLQGR